LGCGEVDYFPIDIEKPNPEIAIPILTATASVSEIAAQNSDKVTISVDSEGRITIFYRGDFLSQTALEIFPPLPLFIDFPISDTLSALPLPLPEDRDIIIRRAIFTRSNIIFKVDTTGTNVTRIIANIPDINYNGELLSREYEISDLVMNGGYLETPLISLDGWELVTSDNSINVDYDAFDEDGNSVKLPEVLMNIDFIAFSYVEGNLGEQVFDIEGNNISIGIFKKWISGGFSFDRPRIILDISNSFGLPMTAIFNKMELVTINGNILPIESDIIDQGLTFNYPSLDEVGEVKLSEIIFDSSNSNLEDIFNEKAIAVNFDVDAFANPPGTESIIGFFTNQSFYNIDAVVEVPLHTRIDELLLADTFDLDANELPALESPTLILSVKNGLPIRAKLKTLFLDENLNETDYLQGENWTEIEVADIPSGEIQDQMTQRFIYPISTENWNLIRTTNRVIVLIQMNTEDDIDEYLWIMENQGIEVNLSVITQID